MALALVLGSDLTDIASDLLAGSKLARAGLLGSFPPSFNSQDWIRGNLRRKLPGDAYKAVSKPQSLQTVLLMEMMVRSQEYFTSPSPRSVRAGT